MADGAGVCFCCLELVKLESFHACHIIPRTRGGKFVLDNLRVGCENCNVKLIKTAHAYEYMISNKMPGVKYLYTLDPHYLFGKSLALMDSYVQSISAKLTKTELKKLNPQKASFQDRFEMMEQVLKRVISAKLTKTELKKLNPQKASFQDRFEMMEQVFTRV